MQLNEIVEILQYIGVFNIKHSGRTLGDHLLNTMELLMRNNAANHVCAAGALHSIYGTNAFTNNVIDYSERQKYQLIIGDQIENLIYLFSIVNRPIDIEKGLLTNYRTSEIIRVGPDIICELRQIEAANLLEQRCSLLPFPNILNEWNRIKDSNTWYTLPQNYSPYY